MKKMYLLLTLIVFAGMVSCDDNDSGTGFDPEKDIVVDRGADPGADYTVEKDVKYVDVFYYIPKGSAPVDDWHWRLSGIATHIQDFFTDNLKKYYQVDKKFEMIRNVANPKYVKIHYLQGSVDLTYNKDEGIDVVEKRDAIVAEINQYWQANPLEKTGHHHFIFMPENENVLTGGMSDDNDDFFAFLSYDNVHFDIKYFDYSSTRVRYLDHLGEALYYSGIALGALTNINYATQGFYPLLHADEVYSQYPEQIRLTEADVLALSEREAFNPRSLEPKYGIDLTRDQFEIRGVKMEATATSISISCDFLSEYPVANLLAYEDPWKRMDDDGEPAPEVDMNRGVSYNNITIFCSDRLVSAGKEDGKYVYRATVQVPVSFIPEESKTPIGNMEYAKSEFRLKFLMECGYVFPERDYLYYPDAWVSLDRFRYQYYWIPGMAQPYLLTDLRDHDEIIYTPQEVSSIMTKAVDGDKSTSWTGFWQNNSAPEVSVKMLDESSTVDGIRIWAPGDKTPLRLSVYVTAGGVESIVVDNRLVPGDENMYKYIEFDRKENVSQLRVRVEKAKENETSIAEIEVYRKRDIN